MKVCLIGDVSGNIDEGMKKMTYNIHNYLSQHVDILLLNPYSATNIKFWKRLLDFNPDIIHYMTGPSTKSLFLLRVMSLFSVSHSTIITVSHPNMKYKSLIQYFRSNYAIVHSEKTEKEFRKYGFKTEFIPNGVDINKFEAVNCELKRHIRKKYSIDLDKFIVLHVGNILPGRNIAILKALQNSEQQVIVVGSTSINVNGSLLDELKNAGCIVITDFISDINELYQLSDCYVFPVEDEIRAIECPLSVLEAAACNLPIIATRFGSLERMFVEKNGFFFIDSLDQIENAILSIKEGKIKVDTRDQVNELSWEKIALRYLQLYEKLNG